MGKAKLEVCVDSVASALAAKRGGADRLELCQDLVIGGTTPTEALFREVRKRVNLPVHVLIRPRYGDFCYSEEEFSVILDCVRSFREQGADGIVFGALKPDGSLDREKMSRAAESAAGIALACHRAFDMCLDPEKTLEELIGLGYGTVLTSGQAASAWAGKEKLKKWLQSAGERICIMPGGGINADNLKNLDREVGAGYYHMSGKRVRESSMQYRRTGVSMGSSAFSEYEIWETDEALVRAAKLVLQ